MRAEQQNIQKRIHMFIVCLRKQSPAAWIAVATAFICMAMVVVSDYAAASANCTGDAITQIRANFPNPNLVTTLDWPLSSVTVGEFSTDPVGLQPFHKAGAFIPQAASGGNLAIPATGSFGERFYSIVGADFNGDGFGDIIGYGDDTDNDPTYTSDTCHFTFIAGQIEGQDHLPLDMNYARRLITLPCLNARSPVMAAVDYNGSGRLAVVVSSISPNGAERGVETNFILKLLSLPRPGNDNPATAEIVPMALSLKDYGQVSWPVAGSQLQFSPLSADGVSDLFALSSDASGTSVKLFRHPNTYGDLAWFTPPQNVVDTAFVAPIADVGVNGQQASSGNVCMPPDSGYNAGGTTLVVNNDYAADAGVEVLAGSVNEKVVRRFIVTEDGQSVRRPDIPFPQGSPRFAIRGDFDRDGSIDTVLFRSPDYCQSGQASGHLLPNTLGYGHTYVTGATIGGMGGTIDFAASLSPNWRIKNQYNTYTGTRAPGIIAGKASANGNYTYWFNAPSKTQYATHAEAVSMADAYTTLPWYSFYVYVGAQLLSIDKTEPSGTSIKLYVRSGGDWELLTPAEMAPPFPIHYFKKAGLKFQYKVVFDATADPVTAANAAWAPSSSKAAVLRSLALNGLQEEIKNGSSRSNVLNTTISSNGNIRDLVVVASTNMLGTVGNLQAFDITNQNSTASALSNATPSGTAIWDAAQLLNAQSDASRVVYTSSYTGLVSSSTSVLTYSETRAPFTLAEVNAPSVNPNLTKMLGVDQVAARSLITFTRSRPNAIAANEPMKLASPGHSSPVLVGPPSQDANYLGNGYSSYKTAQNNRSPVILLGGNEGFLHAFSAIDGSEKWAFMPSNALNRLASTRYLQNSAIGRSIYMPKFFVDGPIQVADIQTSSGWKTVAFVGMGLGTGYLNAAVPTASTRSVTPSANFYWALDVTNPADPRPLWTATQPLIDRAKPCSGNVCLQTQTQTCSTSTVCRIENSTDRSAFVVSTATPNPSGRAAGLAEAEVYDDIVDPIARYQNNNGGSFWGTPPTVVSAKTSGARGGNYMQTSYAKAGGNQACSPYNCGTLGFRFFVDNTAAKTTLYPWFRVWASATGFPLSWGLDGRFLQTTPLTFSAGQYNTWVWVAGAPMASVSGGYHKLTVAASNSNLFVDAVAVQQQNTAEPPAGFAPTYKNSCDANCNSPVGGTVCAANTSSEAPECGIGAGLQCCVSSSDAGNFCAPVGQSCATQASAQPSMGMAFSRPSIGRLASGSTGTWAAFFGSGRNAFQSSFNDGNTFAAANAGRSVYAVDAYTGAGLSQLNFKALTKAAGDPNTDGTIAGAAALVDVDGDGFVDRLYVGDAYGRLFKVLIDDKGFAGSCLVFDAGVSPSSSTRRWAPISVKPAVSVLSDGTAMVLVGTGGDDLAPDTEMYKFYSIHDMQTGTTCTDSSKTEATLKAIDSEWVKGDSTSGGRFWGDPLLVNNNVVYFASLHGLQDGIEGCSRDDASFVYAAVVLPFTDKNGKRYKAGDSFLPGGAASFSVRSPIRAAPIQRGATSTQPATRAIVNSSLMNADILFQQMDGSVLRLTPPVQGTAPARMRSFGYTELSL